MTFRKYLATKWSTFGREIIDAVKARTGKYCEVPYTEINAKAAELVAARWAGADWADAEIRASIVGAVVDCYAPTKPAKVTTPKPARYEVLTTKQPITDEMLARVDYLIDDRIAEYKCCEAFDVEQVQCEVVARMLVSNVYGEGTADPLLWGRMDVLDILREMDGLQRNGDGWTPMGGGWFEGRHQEHEGDDGTECVAEFPAEQVQP